MQRFPSLQLPRSGPQQDMVRPGPGGAAVPQIIILCHAHRGPGDLPSPVGCSVPPPHNQGYQWLKDKILSEEGRRQQAKLKELQAIAERLGCTLPQLAIGKRLGSRVETRVPGRCRESPSACATPPPPASCG